VYSYVQTSPVDNGGQADMPVDPGPPDGPPEPGACAQQPQVPRRQGHHRHPGQLPGAV